MRTALILIFLYISVFTVAQESNSVSNPEKNIDKYLSYFSNDNPGAVVTVIKNGDIIFNKAYGLSNVQTKEIMKTDKAFNLSNLSKAFTSLAILKLIEKNKLNLDNSINDIFQEFPDYGKTVKIKNLLNHSSGLYNYNIDSCINNNQILAFLKSQDKTSFEPGTKFMYSNSDYVLLALIIERVSKMSYSEFLTKNIFKKLAMTNTFLPENSNNKNIAEGHFKENNIYIAKNDVSLIYGEQGIYTNATDFAKWDKALYSDKLLKCESLTKIFTVNEIPNEKSLSYYGYGWVLMKKNDVRYYWHGGSGNGYTNLILHLPDTKTTVLILTNRNDGYDFLKMSIAIAKEFDKELKL